MLNKIDYNDNTNKTKINDSKGKQKTNKIKKDGCAASWYLRLKNPKSAKNIPGKGDVINMKFCPQNSWTFKGESGGDS